MTNETINQLLPLAILAVSAVAILIFIIVSVVLNHHWSKYGIPGEHLKRIRIIYFSVSAVLFAVIGAFTIAALNLS
ncbi:MAG: hypothetical protein A2945_00930 [Candidatus Liptonbacteria bacterium RIFCSPLOWO2_01_FULL_52_25]|uniref:Uncharacterized protein n=1 Tax=Candidatus Liptonbacteria bacterium RIFCSPLOWO2_01_FULL_52_25 TaxID=1798650 RepID=A0A1G2CDF6_9BACT|nr:MAG: hypothetical protein A2945_00930 [Candidatus Liptonbacteria bacterium RIFCSPLOWO2_01_FULL_52_25]